jgi:hypothetical protein
VHVVYQESVRKCIETVRGYVQHGVRSRIAEIKSGQPTENHCQKRNLFERSPSISISAFFFGFYSEPIPLVFDVLLLPYLAKLLPKICELRLRFVSDYLRRIVNELAPAKVSAVEEIRRMRGGTQAHLMRCSDGEYYVVKLQNNPQGVRILANEFLATALAERLGLSVPQARIVQVSQKLIANSDDMVIELPHGRARVLPGLCFGSQCPFPKDTSSGTVLDGALLPNEWLDSVENLRDFVGIFVFDKWAGNTDCRQAVFARSGPRSLKAFMIDHGSCFDGDRWTFPDAPRNGFYIRHDIYGVAATRGFGTFEPWLDEIESKIDGAVLSSIAREIPPEWYHGRTALLGRLLDELDRRRKTTKDILWNAYRRFPECFPGWIWQLARAATGTVG